MTHDAGHDPSELHRPGDIVDEPHGLDDHGEDHGHDDHAHASDDLGPIDARLWGAFAGGIVLGLIPAIGLLLATSG